MSSKHSIGAMNQFADALDKAGYDPRDVTKLRGMLAELLLIVRGEDKSVSTEMQGGFLKLISSGKELIIGPCNGTEILADAKGVFAGGIDRDFRNWGADEPGQATDATPVDVYEMTQDGTFAQMCSSLDADVENLFFTSQAQIKKFCLEHRDWLRRDGYGTFFAFKSNGKRFVARVCFDVDGTLFVGVHRFEYDHVWNAGHRHRFVVPHLA